MNGLTVDLKAALDPDHIGDVGVPASAPLLAYTNAVELNGDIGGTFDELVGAIGTEAATEAAATIAIFNGLVRVADGTGIPLDAGVFAASIDDRELLGINAFEGAANSVDVDHDPSSLRPIGSSVSDLFG